MISVPDLLIPAVISVVFLIIGQTFLRIELEAIVEQRRIIGEIGYALIFYANVSADSTESDKDETRKTLRRLASQLRVTAWTIPGYRLLASLHLIPKRDNVLGASTELIGLSNSFTSDDLRMFEARTQKREAISKALNIDWKNRPLITAPPE